MTQRNETVVVDTPEGVNFVRLAALKGALKMEIHGMHRRGRSAYSIAKSDYGLKGSRAKVLAQLEAMVEKAIADKQARRSA